jgi:hypothetical protein
VNATEKAFNYAIQRLYESRNVDEVQRCVKHCRHLARSLGEMPGQDSQQLSDRIFAARACALERIMRSDGGVIY